MVTPSIIVRPYQGSDRESIRKICCDTAFMGEEVEAFFEDREVFVDFAISYYTDYEPESLFVAVEREAVIGYIAGCLNSLKYQQIFQSRILPKTILKGIARGLLLKPKARVFLLNCFKSLMKQEFKRPLFREEYPAHLHINVAPSARRLGAGEMLMNKLLEYFKAKDIPAVQLSSISKSGQSFFFKMGFTELYSRRITYFAYLVKEPVYLMCFGRKLNYL